MFKAPNFSCRVTEKGAPEGSERSTRLVYAESEQAARAFLDKKDYNVHSVKPYDFAKEWAADTKEACDKAQSSHADPKFEFPNHWGKLKEHLQDLYHDKCAYCDGAYQAFGYGDVEHYRPKKAVTGEKGHPGYWWLAYEPANYLPSCQLCNQAAKKNHFPIAGTRAKAPGDSLDAEDPLLMHPDRDRWFSHVRFKPSTDAEKPACAEELTPKGKTSIEVLQLNRKELRDARLTEQQLARGEYVTALTALVSTTDNAVLKSVTQRYESGLRPFHAAAMDEINSYAARIGFPLPFSKNGGGG